VRKRKERKHLLLSKTGVSVPRQELHGPIARGSPSLGKGGFCISGIETEVGGKWPKIKPKVRKGLVMRLDKVWSEILTTFSFFLRMFTWCYCLTGMQASGT
jgi:hypothetical protein